MLGFWKTKKEGFNVSHPNGLDAEQIQWLQTLKIGDRLKLIVNNPEGTKNSHYTLRKLEEKGNAK